MIHRVIIKKYAHAHRDRNFNPFSTDFRTLLKERYGEGEESSAAPVPGRPDPGGGRRAAQEQVGEGSHAAAGG